MISRIVYDLFVFCLIVGVILIAIAAFLIVGGLLGMAFGTSTSIVLFGFTITLGVLGAAAVKLGIVILFIGAFFMFVAFVLWLVWTWLIPWLKTIAPPPVATVLGARGTSTSSPFTFPLFPWTLPGPNPDLPGFGSGVGPLEILLMPADQLAKFPANTLVMVECLRKCLCEVLCQGETHSHGGPDLGGGVVGDPGRRADDVMDRARRAKEELEAQLATLQNNLEQAMRRADFLTANRLREEIEDVTRKINALG